MGGEVFQPGWGSTISIANAAASAVGVALPKDADRILITNTSLTAFANVMVTGFFDESTVPAGTAATLTNGVKILPASQVQLAVGFGPKVIRTIATAADGTLEIVAGHGG